MLEEIVEHLENVRGTDDLAVLEGKTMLALLQLQQSNWPEAQLQQEELWETTRRVYGEDHEKTITALNNFATTNRILGKYATSEKLYQLCYDLRVQKKGPQDLEAIKVKHSLAVVRGKLGQSALAEEMLLQVIGARRGEASVYSGFGLDRALNDLGEFYLYRDRFAEAEILLVEALGNKQKNSARQSFHLIDTRLKLATALLGQEKSDESEPILSEAIAFFEEHPKSVHASTVEQFVLHAKLLLENERYAAAEQLLRQTLAIVEQLHYFQFLLPDIRSALQESLKGQNH